MLIRLSSQELVILVVHLIKHAGEVRKKQNGRIMVIKGRGFCRQNSRSAGSKNGWSQKEPKYWVIRRYGSGGFRQYMWAIICGSRGLQSAMVSETLDRGAYQD